MKKFGKNLSWYYRIIFLSLALISLVLYLISLPVPIPMISNIPFFLMLVFLFLAIPAIIKPTIKLLEKIRFPLRNKVKSLVEYLHLKLSK